MKIRLILSIIILGMSIYLFSDNFLQIDIAATKNHALMISNKLNIDSTTSVPVLQQRAKHEIDINWQTRKRNSDRASVNSLIFLLLIIFQIAIIALNKK